MPCSSIPQDERSSNTKTSSGTSYSSTGSSCHNFAAPVDSISIPTEDTWMQTGLTLSPVALTVYPGADDVPFDLEPITWDSSWGGTQSSDMFSGTDSYTSNMANGTPINSRSNFPTILYNAVYDRQGLAESTVASSFNSAAVTHPSLEPEEQESAEQLQQEQHPDGYKCRWEGCRYKRNFRRCIELDRHVRSIHIFPRSYHCDVGGCTRSSNRKDNLKEHKLRVHKLRRTLR